MKIREAIRIEGTPFPKPLPVPLDLIQRTFSEHGYFFKDMGNNRTTMLNDLYVAERLGQIQQIIETEGWDVKVTRSVWPEYDDKDYSLAPLWVLNFPDLWVDEIDFSFICDECGRKQIEVDTSIQVSKVKSKRPFHSINGQFKIVSAEVKSAIVGSLAGACFHQFDEQGRYFYLGSECDLGSLVIKNDEVLDYTGECSLCRLPKFTTFFGPLRFVKSLWSGEDIVRESFNDGCLFTPKAFDLLRTFDRSLNRDGIALWG
ncbi:MAG: hypothetical protein JW818_13670 [Pirellulales bacterium]|nr:hypothetical protein [Pirellulales bacterium]